MSLRVMTQGGGTGGASASIFVTGLSETDTVTATKGSKTLRGKWVQKKNPAYVVPDGYTQFEYIQSTGTQYINSKIIPSASTGVRVKTMPLTANTGTVLGAITGIGAGYFGITSYQSAWDAYWGTSTGVKGNIGVNTWSELKLNYMNDKQFTDDGVLLTSLGSASITTNPVHIFRMNPGTYSDPQHYVGRIAELAFTVGSKITNNFVPAKRNSDGAIGMIDIATGVFETNAGSGTFIAGTEVPQYFCGHEINIKEYGMYTVTATNGEKTKTQDVLVDAAVEFEIEMSCRLYLYNEGDECEDITGGWSFDGYGYSDGYTNHKVEVKNAESISVNFNTNIDGANLSKIGTQKAIDTTGYSKLCCLADSISLGGYGWGLGVGADYSKLSSGQVGTPFGASITTVGNGIVLKVDISAANNPLYVSIGSTYGSQWIAKKVWLE